MHTTFIRDAIFVLICLFLSSCHQVDERSIVKKDSVSVISADEPKGDSQIVPNLASVRAEWIAGYSKPFAFDSSFVQQGNEYSFLLRHYCMFDSGVQVPALYDVETHKTFVTHHFNSAVELRKGQDTIVSFTIGAEDFHAFTDPSLTAYGVLMTPDISIQGDTIRIGYSLSIPVTDVGKHVTLYLRTDGKRWVTDD